ncbi:MAG: hypothetical protein ACOZNI_14605 [Myxococcota bacterium]
MDHDCFRAHLEEAIALNEARAPLYAALSEDAARVSRELVAVERAAMPLAEHLDRAARPWQAAGVGVMCDEFVSMSEAPAFAESGAVAPAPRLRPVASGARIARGMRREGFAGASVAIEAELAALPEGRACMTRHVLESMLRAANLAPVHVAEAAALGLASPESLSRTFLVAQIASLPEAARLDRLAAPVHARGVPMLCNDVPGIPAR